MRSTSWPATRATPRPPEKRATGAGDALRGLREDEGRWEKEKPPVFGMIQRAGGGPPDAGGRQADDDRPLTQGTTPPGRWSTWMSMTSLTGCPSGAHTHRTVCHAAGEFARDDDGDGSCEVHVNTMEGFWSLLRSRLRPHRGVSQEKLPRYLGFFEFVHNARRRGRALLSALVAGLVA